MSYQIIGERIKELRLENKLSQAKLGSLLLVSQVTVSLWEKGKSLPTAEYIIAMCKLFEISADYILGLVDYHLFKSNKKQG